MPEKQLTNKTVDNIPDAQEQVSTVVTTRDGTEQAHFNMSTGEVTYGPPKCDPKGRPLSTGVLDAAGKMGLLSGSKAKRS